MSQNHLLQVDIAINDRASVAGSCISKAPSNIDRDLIAKFDEKRKAKYSVLKDLQAHDSGKERQYSYITK